MKEITRFEMDMDGSMEPSEHGEWVRYEDAQRELDSQYKLGMEVERNKLASWMMAQGYATGHGDTIEGLLEELEREIGFKRAELWIKRINEAVLAEREACAKVCETLWDTLGNGMATEDAAYGNECAIAIRARDQR
jgi:hypothetical protein